MDLLQRYNDDPLPFAAHRGVRVQAVEPDKVIAHKAVRPELCTRPAIFQASVTSEDGKLIATARQTQRVIEAKP